MRRPDKVFQPWEHALFKVTQTCLGTTNSHLNQNRMYQIHTVLPRDYFQAFLPEKNG
jgi:hypothetical protein